MFSKSHNFSVLLVTCCFVDFFCIHKHLMTKLYCLLINFFKTNKIIHNNNKKLVTGKKREKM